MTPVKIILVKHIGEVKIAIEVSVKVRARRNLYRELRRVRPVIEGADIRAAITQNKGIIALHLTWIFSTESTNY